MTRQETPGGKAYHFRWQTMIWLAAPAIGIIILLWLVTDHFLADPRYVPSPQSTECHGRVCLLVGMAEAIVWAYLSLPVWIKLPVAVVLAGEALTRLIAPLVWTFDRQPDFTIGPDGVYGPSGLGFFHVPWPEVSSVTRRVYDTYLGTLFGLEIATGHRARALGLAGLGGTKPVTIRLRPIHGFPLQDIVDQIRIFAPEMMIFTEEVTYGRRNRWS